MDTNRNVGRSVHAGTGNVGASTRRRALRRIRALALAGVLGVVGVGCMPRSVTFNFRSAEPELSETEVMRVPEGSAAGSKVALIDLKGVIADSAAAGWLGPGENPVDEFLARLKKAAEDRRVKAVVVRVNSPGGSVAASETLYEAVMRMKRETGKPVVISMGEVAASGGYYVSLAADEIVAQPTTTTGSIGVIVATVNVSDGLRRIGVVSRSVTSGENKDIANPLEPANETHFVILQGMVDEFYARFRGLVVERRPGLAADRVEEVTDGRVVTGDTAMAAGLVDRLGGVDVAVERAMALAGIERASVVKYHEEGTVVRTPFSAEIGSQARAAAEGGSVARATATLVDGEGLLGGLRPGVAYFVWPAGLP